jgi:hypothetical protein
MLMENKMPKALCKSEDQKKIWAAIDARIDGQPTDGLNAEGVYSESVATHQISFVHGLRVARLAAINAIAPQTQDVELCVATG